MPSVGRKNRCLNSALRPMHDLCDAGTFLLDTPLPLTQRSHARRRSCGAPALRHFPEKIRMFSIVTSFGVATLFATILLLMMQIVDDFRKA